MLPTINAGHDLFNCSISKEWVFCAHFENPGQQARSLLAVEGSLWGLPRLALVVLLA